MEQKNATTTDELTEEQLRNAGASATYVAYYKAAMDAGVSTASTNHAEHVVNQGVSYSGGGFHESLWDADPRYPNHGDNPYGADGQNKQILAEANVFPYAEP
jgi:hypothetical protein